MAEEEVKQEEAAAEEAAPEAEAAPAAKPAAGGKVEWKTRFIATFIDAVIAGVACTVIGIVLAIVWIPLAVLGNAIISTGYLLVRDSVLGNGQSPGKKIMKYQVVGPDGKPCSQALSIKRNLPLAIAGFVQGVFAFFTVLTGITLLNSIGSLLSLVGTVVFLYEAYLVFSAADGLRWGDKFAGTKTVKLG